MKRKLMLVMHTSIDGYVAGPDGELDWFENASEHLDFLNTLMVKADSAMFGRKTYELFQQHWPGVKMDTAATASQASFADWYARAGKIVLSNSIKSLDTENSVLIASDQIAQQIQQIKSQQGKDIILFGSPTTAQTLGDLKLIDEYMIFINPVFFRNGIPLFSTAGERTNLQLIDTHTISNGEVALHYRIKANPVYGIF
jgi:dihydrofolate reductase